MPSGTQAGLQRLLARSQKRRERHRESPERSTEPMTCSSSDDDPAEAARRRIIQKWAEGLLDPEKKASVGCITLPIRRLPDP